ncbi:MAG: CGGC domain-containing protein [Deltaproteobacteria bacterium]|nr:CGGC domain-containing protein [Deltaproteobacteria bacterium]
MDKKPVRLIGIIQCDFAKERCSGFGCVNSFTNRIDGFTAYEGDAGVMAVPFNCGGCPGRRIARTAAHLIKRAKKKADIEKDEIVIHLSSCMVTDNGHYPPCPHLDYIEKILKRKGLKVRKGSYKSKTAQKRRDEGLYDSLNRDCD